MKVSTIIGWTLLGTLAGAFLYLLYTGIAHPETPDAEIPRVIATGAVAGAVLLGGRSYWKQARQLARERAAQEQQRRHDAAATARSKEEQRKRLHQDLVSSCQAAQRQFQELPAWLTAAADEVMEARKHKLAGAYSPFWAAVERASVSLGQYNATIHALATNAAAYPTKVSAYRAIDAQGQVPAFPVTLDAASAANAGEPVAAALHAMAYDAQRDPVYSQIWEQRRTTAAVVAGFASLETAIDRMAHAVESSSRLLASHTRDLTAAVQVSSHTVASAVREASDAQEMHSKALHAEMAHAAWLLNDQRERALGWRL